MEPFKIAPQLAELTDHYPDAESVLKVARTGGEQAKIALARLWLSEGIPFAFKECPGFYESVRTWLSSMLAVEAKAINLAGSARLGSSLSSRKRGKSFDETSDLDVFVISDVLFEKMRKDFQSWSADFEGGSLRPGNGREAGFWRENSYRGVKLIQRGFMDSKMIPNLTKYATTQGMNQSMWLLVEKLKITMDAPNVSKASLRCYKTWEAYVRQTILNLD